MADTATKRPQSAPFQAGEVRWVHVPDAGVEYRAVVLRDCGERVSIRWAEDAYRAGRRGIVPRATVGELSRRAR